MTLRKLILLGILILAFALRAFEINKNPLYGDELTMVYDTYSILKTGQSQTGQLLPLVFEMGAGRPGGYIYSSLPFVALFGPTGLGIRLLSVFSGLGIVFLLYLLGKKLFSEEVGLWASFLAAVSPWDLALSRAGFEAHFALFLALLGTVAFFFADKKPRLFFVAAVAWGLTFFTYPTFKLTLPLFLLLIFWYQRPKHLKILPVAVFLTISLLAFAQTFSTRISEERFLSLNIFSKQDLAEEIVQKINLERGFTELPAKITTVFHNKGIEYGRLLTDAYFANLSWNFLFLHGDGNPRHNPAEFGEFYLAEIVFMSLGVFALIKTKNQRTLLFILGWILLVPLGTMLLLETHALRNAFFLPPFALLSAFGVWEFMKFPRKLVIIVFLLWFLQIVLVLERIYFLAPGKHAGFWAAEARLVSEKAIAERNNFDLIFISNKIDAAEFAYPVYAQINPQEVIQQNRLSVKRFGNVVIADKLPQDVQGHILVMELKDLKLNIYEIQK